MSISRENWSALSILAQQWTMEDEEEVERERRRKTKSSVSDVDQDNVFSDDTEAQNTSESAAAEDSDSGGGLEKLQLDFVEMLRVRDEHRRKRHVETLNRQRQEEKSGFEFEEEEDSTGNNMKINMHSNVEAPVTSPPASPLNPTAQSQTSYCPVSEIGPQKENGNTKADSNLTTPKAPHTFVSSVSILFDKNVANPRESPPSQILKKKEEENMPFQRSASLRITAKKFETNQRSNDEEEQHPALSRNSRQRLSSRTIQEKMERLAQASQKWEAVKSPTIAHKTLFLVDEVSRKRELFERDQASKNNPGPNKLDYRTLSAGISSQVNRWVQKKTLQSLSSLTPTDLRHVDISSKKMLFEGGQ
ncbi:ladinin-1 isoform X2 [Astyanax mexicanus]|uniref:ladinin-1 isoform X2 n=1 Tax=Astyanax mexicanus TaxID=7994 RepID=UPI0020CB2D88|nr:ladinin-1 isoform X2 [Astyanax mexicanus]